MKLSILISILSVFALKVFGQTSENIKHASKTQVLVIPAYDEVARRGISPQVYLFVRENLSSLPQIQVVPFGPSLKRTPWQNIFDKKYLGLILEIVQPDIILMSRLDLVDAKYHLNKAIWNLSFRAYNVKADQQWDLGILYRNMTGKQLKDNIGADIEKILTEMLSARSRD